MTSRPTTRRLSMKERDALSRQVMTQRRQEWTSRIRKEKKSHLLSLKRRYVPPPPPSERDVLNESTSEPPTMVQLANQVMQHPLQLLPNLNAFQGALSKDPTSLQPSDLQDPQQLVQTVSSILQNPSPTHRMVAARILTNLAAIEGTTDENSYYGRAPDTWTDVLLRSNTIYTLQRVLIGDDMELITQCCWCVGNMVGDSQKARDAAMPLLLGNLIRLLQLGLNNRLPELCRNAAWALSNLARGDATSSQAFCGPNLLTPALLTGLLMSPERLNGTAKPSMVTWWDVAQEVTWILAFLTAKEDQTVNYLCLSQQMSFSAQSSVLTLEALACRLDHAVRTIRQTASLSSYESAFALRMTIPCVRAVGNLASACDGRHVDALIKAHSNSIIHSVGILLELGSFPSSQTHADVGTVAVEAVWAARTILCDAGLEHHASTDLAAPALLPKLCQCITSGYSKLELKREALSAVWTAAAAPPHDTTMGQIWSTRQTRDELLMQIVQTPHLMAVLVDLLQSMDPDVVLLSLQLVNAILRRLEDGEIRRDFEEHNGVNALERICEVVSSSVHYGSGNDWEQGGELQVAEIAADLIDDLFNVDSQEDEMVDIAPVSTGSTFAFGLPTGTTGQGNGAPVSMGRGRPVPAWMTHK